VETIRLCKGCGAALAADAQGELCAACGSKPERARGGTIVLDPSHIRPRPGAAETTEGFQKFGAYQLIRPLGQGGMGAVYEAEETDSGRRVALKVLSQALDSKEARQRFLREGRLAASVNHPNSVYIFGTEEVEGQPVIAMELVTGGTLQERVAQKGPMPVADAVEAILHVISGLEAAAALGVLHRDVKPSNCFIEADGMVKIGDFGLSKSTSGRGETELTVADSFMGTPAFSSPEQLRGDTLTVASDIYAVGVTLYYLLTAHLPFESENMVRLLAMALEKPPDPPQKWRPEIPAPLNKIVLRCLAKQPAQRFKSYAELRRALGPFSKVAPSPATISLRIAAGIIDKLILPLIAAVSFWLLILNSQTPGGGAVGWLYGLSILTIAPIVYYAVPECLWGGSVGKLLCDLRVVDSGRSFPNWKKAIGRAAIFALVPILPAVIYAAMVSKGVNMLDHPAAAPDGSLVITALMFVAARRSNGFAALHDWATGTRVIERSAYEVTRPLAEKREQELEAPETAERFGPYVVLKTLEDSDTEQWLLALDTALSRKVWIRKFKTGDAPAVDRKRRGLHRTSRVRWLNGRRLPEQNWDAYEALSGESFVSLIAKKQHWKDVRLWLLDLAQELDTAIKDGSGPSTLSLERIWITGTGHAKILDFRAPGMSEKSDEPLTQLDDAVARRFLRQVAFSALEGKALSLDEAYAGRAMSTPLPPHGRAFLNELAEFLDLAEVVARLRNLTSQPAVVTRRRKLGVVAGCAAPLALMIGVTFGSMFFFRGFLSRLEPNKVEVSLKRLQELDETPGKQSDPGERAALETFIAGNLDKARKVTGPTNGFIVVNQSIDAKLLAAGEAIKKRHPTPSPQELAQAEASLAPLFKPENLDAKFDQDRSRFMVKSGLAIVLALPVFGLLSALTFRRGIVLRAARVEIVTREGAPARRWRIMVRAVLTWAPLLLAGGVALSGDTGLTCWIFGLIFAAGLIGAIVTPERSVADRIAGTWLAPA
jgi:serine/threonine protein kinase